MRITRPMITKLKPCTEGWQWYLKEGTSDLKATLLHVNKAHPNWARWLYTRLMTPDQCRRIAIYAAEQALPIFEKAYPQDDRPRKAIAAAKAVLANDTPETRKAARRASYAAAAYAASYAAAAYAAARRASYAAASYAAYAAYAAASAARAAYAYASADADADADADAVYAASARAADAASYASATYAASAVEPARLQRRRLMERKLIRQAVKILEAK